VALPPYDRQRLKEVFAGARVLPAERRPVYVAKACAGNEALRKEVESLLASNERAKNFLETPALAQVEDAFAARNHEGQRIGSYQIEELIGAGGMGEVYRARDTKLNRNVAIKFLLPAVARDPDRLARFGREAQLLASLNHQHIAQIFGLEEAGGLHALVMELAEGPTLAERIAHGPIPMPEALRISTQLAEALEAAHEQGIIHRDLKPANIKVREDGTVKVLDFGLAKVFDPTSGAGRHGIDSPAPEAPDTVPGVILGTAAYMSPEQARGRPIDKRADIWAFGAVLYEMLTGRRVFTGETASDTIAAVLQCEPDWAALPANLPSSVRMLLRGCLAKERPQRIADMSVAKFALEDTAGPHSWPGAIAPRPSRWRALGIPASVWLVGVAMSGAAVWIARRAPSPVPLVSRFVINPPIGAALTPSAFFRDLALTPDGTRLVYVGGGGASLFVRTLDQLDATPITGFNAAFGPFVSPDGEWIGVFDGAAAPALKRVAIRGGPAVTLGVPDGPTRGASWGVDGTIVFATTNAATGLQRISAAGGEPSVLTRPNRAAGEADHIWPEILPDGHSVLFTITALTGRLDHSQIAVLDLRTGKQTVLIRGGSDARYVSTGHLLYAAEGTLRAVAFDLARLAVVGTSVAVLPQVQTTATGAANAAVSANGTLVYVPGRVTAAESSLVWVDRQGHETPIAAPPRSYVYPRLSPDGKRVALFISDQELDIWLLDLSRSTLTRLTSDPGLENYPVWMPDGRQLIFSSERDGARNLFVQADSTEATMRLSASANAQYPTSISPDGARLVFTEIATATAAGDVLQLALDRTHAVTPLVQTPFSERNGEVSPDGRWLAYDANNSGRYEIYVRPFPDVTGGLWQVSKDGGTRPLWARNGQELFYLAQTGALMRVGVTGGASWAATAPTKLFEGRYGAAAFHSGRTYDVSPDGRRLLMIKGGAGDPDGTPATMIVVLNWFEELKRRMSTNGG
jgi:Tol biopolymer transport system component